MGWQSNRVIFEKGLEIHRDEHGDWVLQCGSEDGGGVTPSFIADTFGVRPILAVERTGLYDSDCLLTTDGRRMVWDVQALYQELHDRDPDTLIRGLTLAHTVGAACHHCKSLAQLYAEFSRFWAGQPTPGDRPRSFGAGPADGLYYEFYALVIAVCRSYNAFRYLLWAQFGSRGSTPGNLEGVLSSCDQIPDGLRVSVEQSWEECGKKAKEYRDCIEHNAPLSQAGMTQATLEWVADGVLSVQIVLPDNPQEKSWKKFRYDSKMDALTWGWELTNELVAVGRTIAEAVGGADAAAE